MHFMWKNGLDFDEGISYQKMNTFYASCLFHLGRNKEANSKRIGNINLTG